MKLREAIEIAKKYPNSFKAASGKTRGNSDGLTVFRVLTKDEFKESGRYSIKDFRNA